MSFKVFFEAILHHVGIYCRVSTEHEEQIGSFKNQVEYYTELINRNPEWEMAGIFADEGISGTGTRRRAGFNAMIKACRDGKVDRVITKSIRRFARNTADCLRFSRELRDRGIPIFFEKENIDTMAASGELSLQFFPVLLRRKAGTSVRTWHGASGQDSNRVFRRSTQITSWGTTRIRMETSSSMKNRLQ